MMNSTIGDYGKNVSGNLGTSPVEQREGPVARAIGSRTPKLPSDVFLWAAGASILASLAFQVIGMRRKTNMLGRILSPLGVAPRAPMATFVGQWVPTLLLLGVYDKIVEVAGSDRHG